MPGAQLARGPARRLRERWQPAPAVCALWAARSYRARLAPPHPLAPTHPPTFLCMPRPAAPNVLVWSAVACSSAFPLLFVPQQLLARDSRGQVGAPRRAPRHASGSAAPAARGSPRLLHRHDTPACLSAGCRCIPPPLNPPPPPTSSPPPQSHTHTHTQGTPHPPPTRSPAPPHYHPHPSLQVVGFNAQAAGEMQRRWRDGSLEEDLPMRGLRCGSRVSAAWCGRCGRT